MKPVVHRLEADFWGEVDFIYLDADNSSNYDVMRDRFGESRTIPRFYILAPDGKVLYKWIGGKPASEIRGMLNWTTANYPTGGDSLAESGQRTFALRLLRQMHMLRQVMP